MNVLLHPQTDVGLDEEIDDRIRAGQYQPQLPPKPLSAQKRISGVWPNLPPDDHLHVYIGLPTELSGGKRPRSSSDAEKDAKRMVLISPRDETVSALYKRLQEHGFVQVLS
jgi:hypothetical protein